MIADNPWFWLLGPALAGLVLSVVLEQGLSPRPRLLRPLAAWMTHLGLWLLCYALAVLLLMRPWFSMTLVSAFMLLLVLVSNAKHRALREAFVYQDFEYFTDALKHPRLYIPFLGWEKFLMAASGFVMALLTGFWLERIPDYVTVMAWVWQPWCALLLFACASLGWALMRPMPVGFQVDEDLVGYGLLTHLCLYARAERAPLQVSTPFARLMGKPGQSGQQLPHIVTVQSESFFDPRNLFPGIRPEVLEEFDRFRADSWLAGKVRVPAWGANTIRSEFAFLAGVPEEALGVHRFNPYRALAAGSELVSFAHYLRSLGYRTVCLHPYPGSFYQRDKVLPQLGFDEFIDIDGFAGARRCGPYIADIAVAEKISEICRQTSQPLFVYAITMENHGPLHLEKIADAELKPLFLQPLPPQCGDLATYLRHLRNADQMMGRLRDLLENSPIPATLCWFGDHVPIMPAVYKRFGMPDADVDFFIWNNHVAADAVAPAPVSAGDIKIENLARHVLAARGMGSL